MIALHPSVLAFGAAMILLIVEVLAGTFVFLGFGLGFLAVAAADALTGRFALGRDVLLFGMVAALMIIMLRFAFKRPGDTRRMRGDINDY